jgi:hypothetical protein
VNGRRHPSRRGFRPHGQGNRHTGRRRYDSHRDAGPARTAAPHSLATSSLSVKRSCSPRAESQPASTCWSSAVSPPRRSTGPASASSRPGPAQLESSVLGREPTSLSATAAGPVAWLRPTPSYTTLRHVTQRDPRSGATGPRQRRVNPTQAIARQVKTREMRRNGRSARLEHFIRLLNRKQK